MERFQIDERDAAARVQRARDTRNGRRVVVERGVRVARVRQLHAVPRHAAIASFEKARDDHRLWLVHPAPLELPTPIDEFDVAQAIGSLLDGLAWLHRHDVAHGAVGPLSLTGGPTGGRLSLAGALGERSGVTEADDVYSASALAFQLLVGDVPHAYGDPRLDSCASYAVADAVRAGLHPDPSQRPSAALLATISSCPRPRPRGSERSCASTTAFVSSPPLAPASA